MGDTVHERTKVGQAGEPPLGRMVETVGRTARRNGHLSGHEATISARVDEKLLATVRRQTGLADDDALIAFALAHVALDGAWLEAFNAAHGTLDADVDLDF